MRVRTGDSRAATSRRSFVLAGGATLGAGMAAAAGAAALADGGTPQSALEAREAIRRLHLAFIAGVEDQTRQAATSTHHAYRSNARQAMDQIVLSDDHQRATATWHVDVKIGTPIDGDSTPAQMARLQGLLAGVHWESGRLDVAYVKARGEWAIASMRYAAA